MSRKKRPEPFHRRFDDWWYVQIGKQQIKLARGKDNEDAAWQAYYRVMATQGPAVPAAPLRNPTVTAICNLFLDYSKRAHATQRRHQSGRHNDRFTNPALQLRLVAASAARPR